MSQSAAEANQMAESVPYTPDFDKIFQRSEHTPSPLNTSCNNPPLIQQIHQNPIYQPPQPNINPSPPIVNPSSPNIAPLPIPQAVQCTGLACPMNQIQNTPLPSRHPATNYLTTTAHMPMQSNASVQYAIITSNSGPSAPQQRFMNQQQLYTAQQTSSYAQSQASQFYAPIRPQNVQRMNVNQQPPPNAWASQQNVQAPTQQQPNAIYNTPIAHQPQSTLPSQLAPHNYATTYQTQSTNNVPTSYQNINNVRAILSQHIQNNIQIPRSNLNIMSSSDHSAAHNTQLAQMLSNTQQNNQGMAHMANAPPRHSNQQTCFSSAPLATPNPRGRPRMPRTYTRPHVLRQPIQQLATNPMQTILSSTDVTQEGIPIQLVEKATNQQLQTGNQQPPVSVSSTTRAPNIQRFHDIEVQVEPERFNKACQFNGKATEMISRALNATVETQEVSCQTDSDIQPEKIYVDRGSSPIQFPAETTNIRPEPSFVPVRRKFTAKRKRANDVPVEKSKSDSDSDINVIE